MTGGAPPRGVLFDLDGTLADTVDLILTCYRHTMQAHLGRTPPDAHWLEGIGTPLPVQLAAFARSESERLAMRETYVRLQRSLHDDMVRPFPGAAEVLDRLGDRGVRLGVVTSKARGIARRTMERCGLWGRVEVVVGGDEVERAKPHPEPVLRALAALDLSATPADVVFVGDTPHDVRAGRAAGTRTAAVAWGPHERAVLEAERPDYWLERMDDVLSMGVGRSR